MMPHLAAGMLPPGLLGQSEMPYSAQTDASPGFSGQTGSSSREGSVFYKTRLCHKYAEGFCPNGDRCTYAHGEAELRNLPAEGQHILDARARGSEHLLSRGAPAGSPPSHYTSSRGDERGGGSGGGGGHRERAGVRSTAFKSRLCTRFMQKGECPYGPSCHFAHGYDDLQPAEGQGKAASMDTPAGFDLQQYQRAGMMMMPAEFMAMAAMGGIPGGGPLMPPRPRPPPGPPPGPPSSSDRATGGADLFSPDQSGFAFDVTRTPTRLPSDVPYLERVKAACLLLGVGALQPKDVGREATEASLAAIHTGEAFEANVYADALHVSGR